MFMSISPGTIDGTCWYVEDVLWNIGHVAVVGLLAAATLTAGVDVCLVINDNNNKLWLFQGLLNYPIDTRDVMTAAVMSFWWKLFMPTLRHTSCRARIPSFLRPR